MFVRRGKFHEIFGSNISTNVSESFGSGRGGGWDCLYGRESFVRFFGRNIFTMVNGKFGGSRNGSLSGRESFMRFLAVIFLLL